MVDGSELISVQTTMVGRPRSIIEEDVRKLVELFKQGHTVSTACRISGVPRSTYYDKLSNDEQFSDRVTAAQDVLTWRATQIVTHSMNGHNLQTAKWWLDRMDRRERNAQRAKEYRLIKKLTVTKTYQETQSVEFEIDTKSD
jgi:hypothetical protein